MPSCCTPVKKTSNIFTSRLAQILSVLVVVLVLSYVFSWLEPFRHAFAAYMRMMWWAIIVGFVLGGIMDYYVPQEYVVRVLANKRKRTIFYSVFLGFLMTVCNHGVLAIAMQFYKKGASTSSVVAFLLASPWANFPLTLMMIGFFGVPKAAFLILTAMVIAVIVGLIYQLLERRGIVDLNPAAQHLDGYFDFKGDIQSRFSGYRVSRIQIIADFKGVFKGVKDLADMTLGWLFIGATLAALAAAYVPAHFFHHYMGKTFFGMGFTLVGATLVETCSTGMSPLAFEIYRQTGALGNALVFLMAGVATNYTTMGLLWTNIGRRTALWMPVISVPLILIFGYIGNILFH